MSLIHTVLRVVHPVHVSRLSAWAVALSTRLWLPGAFRPGGVRFLDRPPPAGVLCHLCRGLLVGRPFCRSGNQTPSGLPRSAPVRYDWGGRSLYSGVWCPLRWVTWLTWRAWSYHGLHALTRSTVLVNHRSGGRG